jgi:hypothetical protein
MLTSTRVLKVGARSGARGHSYKKMTIAGQSVEAREPISDREQKHVALGYIQEAWAEARHEGVDGDCLAQTSMFFALAEFVTTYGEEAAAKFTDGLSARIRNGEFSIELPRQ